MFNLVDVVQQLPRVVKMIYIPEEIRQSFTYLAWVYQWYLVVCLGYSNQEASRRLISMALL